MATFYAKPSSHTVAALVWLTDILMFMITSKTLSTLLRCTIYLFSKFHKNPRLSFWVILLTNRQTWVKMLCTPTVVELLTATIIATAMKVTWQKENDSHLCVQRYTLYPGRDVVACTPCMDPQLHQHHQLPNPVPLPWGSRASGSCSSATESDPRTSCSLTANTQHNRFTTLLPGLPGRASARRRYLLLGFMVQGKITEAYSPIICMCATPSRVISDTPPSFPPPFLCGMPFLLQPFYFILAWDRHQICWLA